MESNNIDKNAYENAYNDLYFWFEEYNGANKLSFTSKMSLITSAIKKHLTDFGFVGFYVVAPLLDDKGQPLEDQVLEIGPYCSDILPSCRIRLGKGVCGSSWKDKKTYIENDVSTCTNYIACDDVTKSEIVLPVFKSKDNKDDVIAVLDIDSIYLNRFEREDEEWLNKILDLIY